MRQSEAGTPWFQYTYPQGRRHRSAETPAVPTTKSSGAF